VADETAFGADEAGDRRANQPLRRMTLEPLVLFMGLSSPSCAQSLDALLRLLALLAFNESELMVNDSFSVAVLVSFGFHDECLVVCVLRHTNGRTHED